MLSQLSVKNLAVVETLDLSFKQGMSVVTGETGAGKSILLQALNLVLGGRGDATLVRLGADKAEISASFDVTHYPKIQNHLQVQSLEDEGECILRRVLNADGRSRAFVNSINVPLSVMRGVGELLVDMHGQNEHQLLLRPNQQRQLLDTYADTQALCTSLNLVVNAHKQVNKQIEDLNNSHQMRLQQQELLTHQLKELNDAILNEQELSTIEAEFKTSANSATLIEKASGVLNQLENEAGINTQLLSINHALSEALDMDKALTQTVELLLSAQLQTQEGIYELTHYLNDLFVDDKTVKTLEARLGELHGLARRHACQIPELLTIKNNIKLQLDEISTGMHSLDELNHQKNQLQADYQEKAAYLSKIRTSKARELSNLVTQTMQVLGMPNSEFSSALPSKSSDVRLNGAESVDFLVKTNMGQDFKPLKKVASGGELSRISLAISVIGSGSEYTPTLIFDEVDVGISGAVAEVVGKKLKQLSEYYQVICITHLAQVAAFGHQHLRVQKAQNKDGAQTTVTQLSSNERVNEIARILGGVTITDKARNAAEEMIGMSV